MSPVGEKVQELLRKGCNICIRFGCNYPIADRRMIIYTACVYYYYYYYYMIYIAPISRIESEALASLGGEHD